MVSENIIRKFIAQIKEKHKEINEPTIEKIYLSNLISFSKSSIE